MLLMWLIQDQPEGEREREVVVAVAGVNMHPTRSLVTPLSRRCFRKFNEILPPIKVSAPAILSDSGK